MGTIKQSAKRNKSAYPQHGFPRTWSALDLADAIPLKLSDRVTLGLIAFAAIEVQAFTQILFSVEGGDPLYLNSLQAGPLYSVFGIALIGLTIDPDTLTVAAPPVTVDTPGLDSLLALAFKARPRKRAMVLLEQRVEARAEVLQQPTLKLLP